MFTISDSDFVSYTSEEDKGNTLRLEFTDTVSAIKTKVKTHLNLPESAELNLIEVN